MRCATPRLAAQCSGASGASRPGARAMALSPPGDVEELALCSCCRRAFDDAERAPKLLACKHHFCLACARSALPAGGAGAGVRCVHCWKRTELPGGRAERLPTHAAVLALARRLAEPPPAPLREPALCRAHALPALWCRACAQHALRPPHEARALLARDAGARTAELRRLAARHRDFLVRALDATAALGARLEAELATPPPSEAPSSPPTAGGDPLADAAAECERLRALHAAALRQGRLDDLVRGAAAPPGPEMVRRALAAGAADAPSPPPPPDEARDPVLFLANYCATLLHARQQAEGPAAAPAGAFPLYFLELTVDGAVWGRVVVQARCDVAPRMCRAFGALATGAGGAGASYRGCCVFQCWEGESVIAGEVEPAGAARAFAPDESRLAAVRGAVGMRRSQRRHDSLGLVASQFRIVLREMRGFTAIFGSVVHGLELVDRISRTGDGAGKPHAAILISACGRLD